MDPERVASLMTYPTWLRGAAETVKTDGKKKRKKQTTTASPQNLGKQRSQSVGCFPAAPVSEDGSEAARGSFQITMSNSALLAANAAGGIDGPMEEVPPPLATTGRSRSATTAGDFEIHTIRVHAEL